MEENLTDREINRITSMIVSLEGVLKDKKEELAKKKKKICINVMRGVIREYYNSTNDYRIAELRKKLEDDDCGLKSKIYKEYVPTEGILAGILEDKLEEWMDKKLDICNYVGDFIGKIPGLMVDEIIKGYGLSDWVKDRCSRLLSTIFDGSKYYHFTELIDMSGSRTFRYKTTEGRELIHVVRDRKDAVNRVIDAIYAGGGKEWEMWEDGVHRGEKSTTVTIKVIVPNEQSEICKEEGIQILAITKRETAPTVKEQEERSNS